MTKDRKIVVDGVEYIAMPELGVFVSEEDGTVWADGTKYSERCLGCVGDKTGFTPMQVECGDLPKCDDDNSVGRIFIRPEDLDRYREYEGYRAILKLNRGNDHD